jgi:hypothetical protein
MIKQLLIALILSAASISVNASDVYAVLGMAIGSSHEACTFYQWTGDVLFHNTGDTEAIVRALNVSNGQPSNGAPTEFVIPPHRTDSLHSGVFFSAPLLVVKFDVPDNVVVESRIEIGTQFCAGPPPIGNPNRGKLSFPTFRSLQSAGVAKVHLGTDLASMSARNNVAVYNASSNTANAHIEVRRGCDDTLIDSRDIQIPAYRIVSSNGLSVATGRDLCGTTAPWVTYVVVVVDQPSLSWVSTLANNKDISVVYGATSSSP